MNSYLSSRAIFGAAIVGLVGAAGMFIYEQIYAEKRRTMLMQEMARLDKQVSSMRTELETLRELQKEAQLRRLKQKKRIRREVPRPVAIGDSAPEAEHSYASDSEYFTDYQSVVGTDGEMDSEEFFDVPSDDEDTLRETLFNGHTNVLDEDSPETDAASSLKSTAKLTT